MKTPRGFIVWQRSGMKRAILYLARSFRRPPTNTPANHTKHSRRLTTNLVNYVTSSLNKLTLDPIPPIASVNDARVTISNRTQDRVAGVDRRPYGDQLGFGPAMRIGTATWTNRRFAGISLAIRGLKILCSPLSVCATG